MLSVQSKRLWLGGERTRSPTPTEARLPMATNAGGVASLRWVYVQAHRRREQQPPKASFQEYKHDPLARSCSRRWFVPGSVLRGPSQMAQSWRSRMRPETSITSSSPGACSPACSESSKTIGYGLSRLSRGPAPREIGAHER